MKIPGILAGAALLCVVAAAAAAERPRAEICDANVRAVSMAAWSLPAELDADAPREWSEAAFRGLSCARCSPTRHYCVVNPLRYEYACAPLGSVACISSDRTAWCPANRGCWAGRCR